MEGWLLSFGYGTLNPAKIDRAKGIPIYDQKLFNGSVEDLASRRLTGSTSGVPKYDPKSLKTIGK